MTSPSYFVAINQRGNITLSQIVKIWFFFPQQKWRVVQNLYSQQKVSTTHGEVWSSTDFQLLEWDCSIAYSYASPTQYHYSPLAPVQPTAISIYSSEDFNEQHSIYPSKDSNEHHSIYSSKDSPNRLQATAQPESDLSRVNPLRAGPHCLQKIHLGH